MKRNNAGKSVANHFPDVRKTIEIGSKADMPVDDILL